MLLSFMPENVNYMKAGGTVISMSIVACFGLFFFSQFVEFKFLPDNSFAQRQDCQYSINWSLLNFSLPQKRLNIVNFNFNF